MPRLFAAPPDHAGGGITPVELSGVPGAIDEGAVRLKYGRLTRLLIRQNISVTTMESCTSGQIASLITDTEGASAVFRGAYVTYCNAAKIALGVPAEVIEEIVRFCLANRREDTDWVVLPVANFDCYFGNTNFSRKWLSRIPEQFMGRSKDMMGVCRVRIKIVVYR
jgi:hypothetical protein